MRFLSERWQRTTTDASFDCAKALHFHCTNALDIKMSI
jgi:hypothetical protein